MALKKYKEKRSFERTPEPGPAKKRSSVKEFPRFCVQKHAASHMHYDFRLEYNGVLLSWAVPKGPSLNPKDKRLAMKVEDHPYDYREFEGVIPTGNYGAGTVMLWDEGFYTVEDKTDKKEIEKAVGEGLKKGKIAIVLAGSKLKGKFAFIRTKGQGNPEKESWLLIKELDEYVDREHEITEKNRSVRTKRSMEQIAKDGLALLG